MGNYKRSGIYLAVVDRICSRIDCAGWDESLPANPTSEVGSFYRDYLSTVFAGEEIIAYAASPVVWLLTYVVTGAPRILP